MNYKIGKVKQRSEVFPPGPDHPDYNTNPEKVKRKIGSAVTRFRTTSGRTTAVSGRNTPGNQSHPCILLKKSKN